MAPILLGWGTVLFWRFGHGMTKMQKLMGESMVFIYTTISTMLPLHTDQTCPSLHTSQSPMKTTIRLI